MQMQWYYIMEADIKSAARNIKNRFKRHPIVSVFFIINLFAAITVILNMILFMQRQGYELPVETVSEVELFLLYFMLIFARVFAYTFRNLLKQRAIGIFFTIDLPPGQLLVGKFLAFLWFIASMIFVAGGVAVLVIIIFEFQIWIPLTYIVTGVLLLFIGTALGFITPIMIQLEPLRTKLIAVAIPGVLTFGVYFALSNLPVGNWDSLLMLFGLMVLGMIAVYSLIDHIQKAWITQSMKGHLSITRPEKDYLRPVRVWSTVNYREAVVARKELVIMFRDRDTILAVIAAIVMGISLIILHQFIGEPPAEMGHFARYFYPTIVAVSMFSGAIIICSYPALASISGEGRKLWLLKILPVSNREVVRGKIIAILILSMPLMFFIGLPIQILAQFPVYLLVFFSIMTVALAFTFTGLGIWTGAKFPNFDRAMRGIPDIMSLYFMITLCLLIGFPLIAFPANFMMVSIFGGFITIFIALVASLIILTYLIERAAHAYGKIKIDAYQ